jgi:hypothetical protein
MGMRTEKTRRDDAVRSNVEQPVPCDLPSRRAELLFTVRQVDLTDEEFERDVSAVGADLERLKELLEA